MNNQQSHLMIRMHAAMQHASWADTMILQIATSFIYTRYPDRYHNLDWCSQMTHMVLDLVEYVARDPNQPAPVYNDHNLHTPCEDDICNISVTFFIERFPTLAKAPEPELQLYHMLMMLLDYMIADPRLPDPTTFD
jgi:hypothetical protein